jgi:hypothetical protein
MVAGILGVEDILIDDKRCASCVCCVPNPIKPNRASYFNHFIIDRVPYEGTVSQSIYYSLNFKQGRLVCQELGIWV